MLEQINKVMVLIQFTAQGNPEIDTIIIVQNNNFKIHN